MLQNPPADFILLPPNPLEVDRNFSYPPSTPKNFFGDTSNIQTVKRQKKKNLNPYLRIPHKTPTSISKPTSIFKALRKGAIFIHILRELPRRRRQAERIARIFALVIVRRCCRAARAAIVLYNFRLLTSNEAQRERAGPGVRSFGYSEQTERLRLFEKVMKRLSPTHRRDDGCAAAPGSIPPTLCSGGVGFLGRARCSPVERRGVCVRCIPDTDPFAFEEAGSCG